LINCALVIRSSVIPLFSFRRFFLQMYSLFYINETKKSILHEAESPEKEFWAYFKKF